MEGKKKGGWEGGREGVKEGRKEGTVRRVISSEGQRPSIGNVRWLCDISSSN
jgi:hypothetical protein